MGWILTSTQDKLDYETPQPEAITLRSVARGLSRESRYAGQSDYYYTVGVHVLAASYEAEARNEPSRIVYGILHHDDSEAFMKDLPTPLKALLPYYKKLEDDMSRTIWVAVSEGIPDMTDSEHAVVKSYDDMIFFYEANRLFSELPDGHRARGVRRTLKTANQFESLLDNAARHKYIEELYIKRHKQLMDTMYQERFAAGR